MLSDFPDRQRGLSLSEFVLARNGRLEANQSNRQREEQQSEKDENGSPDDSRATPADARACIRNFCRCAGRPDLFHLHLRIKLHLPVCVIRDS